MMRWIQSKSKVIDVSSLSSFEKKSNQTNFFSIYGQGLYVWLQVSILDQQIDIDLLRPRSRLTIPCKSIAHPFKSHVIHLHLDLVYCPFYSVVIFVKSKDFPPRTLGAITELVAFPVRVFNSSASLVLAFSKGSHSRPHCARFSARLFFSL